MLEQGGTCDSDRIHRDNIPHQFGLLGHQLSKLEERPVSKGDGIDNKEDEEQLTSKGDGHARESSPDHERDTANNIEHQSDKGIVAIREGEHQSHSGMTQNPIRVLPSTNKGRSFKDVLTNTKK